MHGLARNLARFGGTVGVVVALLLAPTATASAHTPSGKWDRLAQCESGGDWKISTGNGYYGGLQFSRDTWIAYGGGKKLPHRTSRKHQIAVAERVLAVQGWNAWPACSRKLGFRRR